VAAAHSSNTTFPNDHQPTHRDTSALPGRSASIIKSTARPPRLSCRRRGWGRSGVLAV